ncbi:MAG: bifunctional phosphopantothenoylcysteine decarboxylase/phosphopantothenate--cysteine ligase CoaBC [Muribaculaceae bacterium]|nr:bifunctional phosphopantothenoylcysteine decarboxylase/phosphopantothenate--cysteine ligase CoaBC [Bacteroidales bacterium]MDY6186581.1 bifunctional phosphopantothenoylcysteine decarboxylase/phosphopantothenate--cysteine ligase CoaBC [Muribaculaceae bacterium]
MLKGKNIILGISGGIAAYKSVYLLRLLVKAGAQVQVIITPNGKEFITPVTLSTLSGRPVISEFFTANTGQWNSHVDLGLWADAMIVAPATACTMAKMANGVADNMLVTTYLSARCPIFVAPAMDLDMMAHPSTVRNITLLRSYGNHIIEAASGELASHLCGKGRMEEPEKIVAALDLFFAKEKDYKGKKIMITAGPTYEKIDPVRFIGNYSSGKMGYALARAAAERGAYVTLISGPVSLTMDHPGVKVVAVESAREMLEASQKAFEGCDMAIMAAAVADYAPETIANKKIKRETTGIDCIRLVKNPDIAKTLGGTKRPEQRVVGFALETNDADANAMAKLRLKQLDAIVLNSLTNPGTCFGVDNNQVTVMTQDGTILQTEVENKAIIADKILTALKKLF